MLQRWDPFAELRRMEDTMNRLWRGFAGNEPASDAGAMDAWALPLDVVEEPERVVVKASLPGINPDNIDVSIEDRVLTIKGQTREEHEKKDANFLMRERRSGSFYRAIRLPEYADADKADCSFEHGVLTVTLPKTEAHKPKQLKVRSGEQQSAAA